MNRTSSPSVFLERPTRVRYGVLGFACALSMVTYLDRVCFSTVAPYIQSEFGLNDKEKGMLFSAFALAYAVFEVPTGWLGDMFGAKKTLIRVVLWWSAFTALTGLIFPIAALPWFAFTAMLAVRFLFGMGEAGAYPNIAGAFRNWLPFGERGFAQGAVWMSGRFAGGVTHFVVTALFIYETLPDGTHVVYWRHIFWIFGALGIVWCVLFWWWFRDHPEQKAGVNKAELSLIHGAEPGSRTPPPSLSTAIAPVASAPLGDSDHGHAGVPWQRLLTNVNLWLLCALYFCLGYGWYFNITWLPSYLKEHYRVDDKDWTFSLMAGAPLLSGAIACLVGGLLTDAFIRRTGNRKWGRRLFGVVGHGVCALCYFASIWAADVWLFVLSITLAAFWSDMTMGSAWASCIDIGKRYSGIVAGCMNTTGNLGGAMAGVMTGLLLEYLGKDLGWQINFLTFGAVNVLASCLWLRFDSTRPVVPQER